MKNTHPWSRTIANHQNATRALARAVIDVGPQRSSEVRIGVVGGEGQCVRCFRATDGSDSDDWCADCLTVLRGDR